jgi:hypothetical protein
MWIIAMTIIAAIPTPKRTICGSDQGWSAPPATD